MKLINFLGLGNNSLKQHIFHDEYGVPSLAKKEYPDCIFNSYPLYTERYTNVLDKLPNNIDICVFFAGDYFIDFIIKNNDIEFYVSEIENLIKQFYNTGFTFILCNQPPVNINSNLLPDFNYKELFYKIIQFNMFLCCVARKMGAFILDLDRIISSIGTENAYLNNNTFSEKALQLISKECFENIKEIGWFDSNNVPNRPKGTLLPWRRENRKILK